MKNKMRKISAILVLSLFIVGMFPAAVLAQKTTVKKTDQKFLAKAADAKIKHKSTKVEIKKEIKKLKDIISVLKNKEEFTQDDALSIQRRLSKFLENIIKRAERTKTEVANSCIDENNANDLMDRVITWADNLKTEVDAIDPNTATREDLNEVLREFQKGWSNVKGILYTGIGNSIACKYRHLQDTFETLNERFEEIVDQAELDGKDVTDARAMLTEMEHRTSSLETDWDRIVSMWREVATSQDALNAAKKSHNYLKNSANIARTTYKQVKDIIRDLNNQ